MNIIRLLPDHIANQIAAGEVIQRPASVVKELVENAIDAGAENIHVIIKDAGKTLIQVIDNGKGMSSDDALMSFERHATSKIQNADDLFALQTKGFRGEALASIAAIAHVELKTKQANSKLGTHIRIAGSRLEEKEETVCSDGTSFEIKNLFYNVPARRNFLKSEQIEFRHIVDEFERIVLPHPEISFVLENNGKVIYNLEKSNLRRRIVDIFGKNINDKLVPIEENTDIVKVTGFIGKPDTAKKKRGEQFFFVNHRFFKDTYLGHAVSSAYENLIAPKQHPSYFLFLEIDTDKIDVNVHPTKTEIKFEEDKFIYSILRSAVKQALGKYNLSPSLDFERENSFDLPYSMLHKDPVEPQIVVNPNYNPFKQTSSGSTSNYSSAIKNQGFGNNTLNKNSWENFYDIKEEALAEVPTLIDIEGPIENEIGKSFLQKGNYIITEYQDALLFIHRRRAIHRIVYDEMMENFISRPLSSQTMLFPIEKDYSAKEISELQQNKSMLQRMGFEFEIEAQKISISAVPEILQQESIVLCLDDILEKITYRDIDKGEIAHVLINSISKSAGMCKLEKLNDEAYQHFLHRLFECEDHQYSPDAKMIMNEIKLTEINQRF